MSTKGVGMLFMGQEFDNFKLYVELKIIIDFRTTVRRVEWKKSNGKLKIAEDYGIHKKGLIGFQDHGSRL